MRRLPLLLICSLVLVNASVCSAQILHKKKKVDKSTDSTNTVEPDKLLYDRAVEDVKHGKHEVGRLGLQTLINTYPDSEYLAKAKLAIADSYYKEGGSSNTTQAIAGYKDFIVFFPFMAEAAYAQMQVAMCNFNEMPKPDRDNTHAHAAEDEFQTFLSKYPKDPLAPEAQQHLREVQEVLAEGQFRIAYYYYVKGDKRASAGRLIPLVQRYPLYSKTDTGLWMLGDIFEKSERKDVASKYYEAIVKNYPLSKYDADAKAKLVAFGVPVPQADPKALAWMTAELNAPRPKESLPHRGLSLLKSGPDVHRAAVNGAPQMEPESESLSASDILNGGNRIGNGISTGTNAIVTTVKPGDPAPAAGSTGSAEDVTTSPVSDPPANPDGTAPAAATTTTDGTTSAEASSSSDPAKPDAAATPAADPKNQKESSSKKKGLKKLIPW